MNDFAGTYDSKKIAGFVARLLLGAVFIYSGSEKLLSPREEFAAVIAGYGVFSPGESMSLAGFIPWAELFLGLFVLAGNLLRTACFGLGILLVSFMASLADAMKSGIRLENCGCFGQGIHLSPWQALALDVFLLCLAVTAGRHGAKVFSVDHWVKRGKWKSTA